MPRGPRVSPGATPKSARASTAIISSRPTLAGEQTSKTGNPDALRFVPLGGLEEVGRNCMFLEYKDEIVLIDVGLQFPEDETPGIDYIIPNVQYLEKKKQNIIGIVLTHGHYDHIGALPHLLEKLGNPPIYTTSITKAIIEKRQDDFPNSPKMKIQVVKGGDELKLSNYFDAVFFGVPHTIPETTGVLMKTPIGNVVHFADFRVDYNDAGEPQGLVYAIQHDAVPNVVNATGSNSNDGISGNTEANSVGSDDLDNLIAAVDPAYRIKAKYMMSWRTIDFLRKLKDKYGRPLWIASLAVGEPDRIYGYPFDWNSDMDIVGAGKYPILFGDFSKYIIRTVGGVTMVRYSELYMPTHQVGFQAFLRNDGRRLQPNAFSLLYNPLS